MGYQSNTKWLPDHLELIDESLVIDGFDDCILGVSSKSVVIYDQDAIIAKLKSRGGMSIEEATEYFYYNIDGAHVGEYTPVYMKKI